jgi:hypothetical protein
MSLVTIEGVQDEKMLNNVEYINSFGALVPNGVLLHKYNESIPMDIDCIRKCSLYKVRKLHFNFLVLISSIILFFLGFNKLFFEIRIFLFAISSLMFIAIPFIKIYKYHFVILKQGDFIKIEIENYLKDDAKKLTSVINRKIKENRKAKVNLIL